MLDRLGRVLSGGQLGLLRFVGQGLFAVSLPQRRGSFVAGGFRHVSRIAPYHPPLTQGKAATVLIQAGDLDPHFPEAASRAVVMEKVVPAMEADHLQSPQEIGEVLNPTGIISGSSYGMGTSASLRSRGISLSSNPVGNCPARESCTWIRSCVEQSPS